MKSSLQVFVAVCLLMVQTAFSQTITLSFTGCTNHREYVQLDSVRVENLTRNWTEKLIYPDTVLILDDQTSVSEVTEDVAKCISYPNPFHGTSRVALTLPQSGQVTLFVYNMQGQQVMEKCVQVEAGESDFEISLDHPQVYFLIVHTVHGKLVQKLINTGHAGGNSIVYMGTQNHMPSKTRKLHSSKPFQRGDILKVNGYVTFDGEVIVNDDMIQEQWVDESYTLYFILQDKDIPVVVTDTVTSIMDSSAVGGGNVINDGKAPVTARGICWDTLPAPTISGKHTVNGSGLGVFISNMTGLTPGTTYYVRAYATNSEGTAYGNEVTFTTATKIIHVIFSVSATDSVEFSPGNLQWSATNGGAAPTTHTVAGNGRAAGTWRFAPNQWDTIGIGNRKISSTYTGWIDLFGWGTSGYHYSLDTNNVYYQPYSTSYYTPVIDTVFNYYGYGPSLNMQDTHLIGTSANYDWGVYNAVYNPRTNSTDAPGTWRTLTQLEWSYLLETRSTASGVRFAKATVNGVAGIIIVPDNWSQAIYTLDSVNTGTVSFATNVITAAQWVSVLENAGCVFLPAAGSRSGSSVFNVSTIGVYWASTGFGCNTGHNINFQETVCRFQYFHGNARYYGHSVRLVRSLGTPAPELPIVITDTVSNITDTTAVCGGNVINEGGVAVTARGICWDTLPAPTVSGKHIVNGSGLGRFTSNITGLKPNTTYYVRAYATNSVGTAYGNEVSFTTPAKIICGIFSVSATDSVEFSPGNLQWSATNGGNTSTTHAVAGNGTAAGTWRFAPNQWDTIGANNNNISSSYTGWIDLFGWGTSGWNNGNYFYQPYSTSYSTSAPYTNAVGNGYGPTDGNIYSYSLTGIYANSDWGVYNAIYNPKTNTTDAPGTWRTPTSNEWNYLLCNRNTASGIRYAKATVNGVTGLIVVPDNWNASTYALDSTNMGSVAFTSNVISAAKWTVLEKAGAIFLPAAGDRLGTYTLTSDRGYYWSVTCYDDHSAYSIVVIRTNVQCWGSGGNRFTAKSVRLVKDVK
ncbi:MAG: T9SS type A sorting domain-containing protein [Bacteroidales bacterium]|nr:T9SS type A sorting domain-containing protein [Bacteroidales bacterium]